MLDLLVSKRQVSKQVLVRFGAGSPADTAGTMAVLIQVVVVGCNKQTVFSEQTVKIALMQLETIY